MAYSQRVRYASPPHVAICASLRRGTKFAGCLMTGRAGGAAGTARRCGAGRLEWPIATHATEQKPHEKLGL